MSHIKPEIHSHDNTSHPLKNFDAKEGEFGLFDGEKCEKV